MSNKKQQLATIHSIPDEHLDRAIKIAQKIFGFDDVSVDYALEHNRPKKIRFLSVIPDDEDQANVERFFKVISKFVAVESEAEAPAPRKARAAAAPAPRKARAAPEAPAKKVAKAAPRAKVARETVEHAGKILIQGDAAKIAEALGARSEIAAKGSTTFCKRGLWSVEAVQGKGVIIKGVVSSNLAAPLYYLRKRLGGTALLRKARVHVDLSESHAARAGLVQTKDGGYAIDDRG